MSTICKCEVISTTIEDNEYIWAHIENELFDGALNMDEVYNSLKIIAQNETKIKKLKGEIV